ncbi:hypothetical protein FNV43_RR19719 [Rhamnella rubrinervis]|uniref:PB1 domain-containing protein n=1 Tax=Rhamnella rubrinervis TaxID=2594499 RepID=A0A8K0DYD5_9ROSA|nr:hypothetical protein FNV43_RR19719 [Rhamnella rubrinervis]
METEALNAFGGGIFRFWQDETHLIYLRDDIPFEDVKKQMESLSGKPAYKIRYDLPGQGLITLSSDKDVENMIGEFEELRCKQGQQMFKIYMQLNVKRFMRSKRQRLVAPIAKAVLMEMKMDGDQVPLSNIKQLGNSTEVSMEGSGTLGNSQASYSITESDGSTVKINTLFYFGRKPKFSESDGKLQIAEGRLPHLVRLRNDMSFEQFKKIMCSLSQQSYAISYHVSYYLPGQGLIALATEEDMKI